VRVLVHRGQPLRHNYAGPAMTDGIWVDLVGQKDDSG
jgi:hypothetical protein